jgi:hypothetical protein
MPTWNVYRDYTDDEANRGSHLLLDGVCRVCRFSMACFELLPASPMTFFESDDAEGTMMVDEIQEHEQPISFTCGRLVIMKPAASSNVTSISEAM